MAKEKWETLQHNGVLFPKEYEYKNFDSNLSPLAEEMLYHYAAKLDTDYVKNDVFNQNFWNALKSELPKSYQEKQFPKDFSTLIYNIYKYIQLIKEEKKIHNKNLTKEQKQKEKEQKEKLKEQYGYAILNGKKQPLGMYQIEPPGIFIARGDHPMLGQWKFRVKPSDVTINHSKHLTPPKGPWSVKENKKSMELATYPIRLSGGFILRKRILFSALSEVKQNADQKKFEKAIKLLKVWNKVENYVDKNLNAKDEVTKQSAMVLYLIMNLGIRVGDEKDEEFADTVGASSLRKEHIKLKDNNIIFLSFLGKDSVKYENEVQISEKAYNTLIELYKTKNDSDMLFPLVSSGTVNKFLSNVITGLSVKVFRTAHGSNLLAEALREVNSFDNLSDTEKLMIFNNANLVVAKQLNHQKNVNKKKDNEQEKKKEATLEEAEKKVIELRKKNSKKIDDLTKKLNNIDSSLSKEVQKQLKDTILKQIQKLKDQLIKANDCLQSKKYKESFKNETADIALGTSKTAYSSPKIVVSWCKASGLPIEKIYSKTLIKRFEWAMNTDKDYYKKYPNVKD